MTLIPLNQESNVVAALTAYILEHRTVRTAFIVVNADTYIDMMPIPGLEYLSRVQLSGEEHRDYFILDWESHEMQTAFRASIAEFSVLGMVLDPHGLLSRWMDVDGL